MLTDFFLLMKSELSLTLIIFILLFVKVSSDKEGHTFLNAINVLLFLNLLLGFFFNQDGELFGSMFHTNNLVAVEKTILNAGTLIISLQAYDWLKTHKHIIEFYILLLATLLGMFFMISSNNLLMFYLGLELSSIPLAALVNLDMGKIKSSEGGMKMILSSAFASCFTLFGISMLYGTTGTLNFSEMSPLLNSSSHLQVLAFIFVFAGFAFKLSVVPFHLWTADVYEGAPVPVTSYLSVISKGATVFVFLSVLMTLFQNLEGLWYNMLFLLIILTITVGNLFAIRQDNIKRFLAFSSIAQVGYILLGLSAGTGSGTASAIYFLIIYTFSNLGAFGVIALISAKTGKENMSDYKGLYTTNPMLVWIMAISLFSLAGIPPTAGFFGKMFLVATGAAKGNYLLISVAALNMVVSLYYYLKLVKYMFIDKNETPILRVQASMPVQLSMYICTAGVVLIGFAGSLFEHLIAITGK